MLMGAALLFGAPAHAQDKTGEVDKIFGWATPSTPGCAVAVSRDGRVVVNRGYGSADLERDVPIGPGTIFDAGSLTKQFVAASVLLLVEEGGLSLTDDVRKYIPELPDYGRKISLDHLLTHTSGVRDWTGILPLAGGNVDALTVIFRQRGLNFAPGEEWSYSNSGYALLKEVVARRSGVSFGEFTRKRLFDPLGMRNTAYRADLREVVKNRALAYDKGENGWRMAMRLDNDRGGGALLSTAGDLLVWNDALANNRLGSFVTEKLHEPARLNNGRRLRYARGLFMDTIRGSRFWWHGGSADGYKSVLGRFPEQGLSIAIMCNSGDGTDRTAFARRIFELYAPANGAQESGTAAPPVAAEGVDVAGLELSGRAGLFFREEGDGESLRLVVDRGRLRVANGPFLVATGPDRFKRWGDDVDFMSGDEFELRFLSQARFELKSMEGKTARYNRARPFTPAADDLKAFAGRYESAEAGTVFRIEPKGEGLSARLEHAPARSLELRPVAPDTFQMSRVTLRFRRDESGKVVALHYGNLLVRDIEFTRLTDR